MAAGSDNQPKPSVVVGVCGGIAAYKAAQLVSDLVQGGAGVSVVMTKSSQQFIGESTFAALTGRPVATGSFQQDVWPLGPHIELAEQIDCLCVAPATADMIGKLANGIADDLLTTLYLQVSCPVLIAPAMSNQMWEKPAVQRNLAQLDSDGVQTIGPDEGWLSCRKKGPGRMSDPAEIAQRVRAISSESAQSK